MYMIELVWWSRNHPRIKEGLYDEVGVLGRSEVITRTTGRRLNYGNLQEVHCSK
jgi:hypothetical protein